MRKLISSGSLGKNVFSYNVTDLTKKYDKVVKRTYFSYRQGVPLFYNLKIITNEILKSI